MSDDEGKHASDAPGEGDRPADGDGQGAAEQPEADYFPGEKGRRIPRSAWWVLGVAVVALVAFLIVRPYWFKGSTSDLHVPADRHFTKTLAGLGQADGVWLSDDAPSTSFTVPLPVDAEPGKTQLRLHGSTQVAPNSTVFLVVAMNGKTVYKRALPSGDNVLDQTIQVPAGTVDSGEVRVRVRTQGTLHGDICMPDHSAGMLIHLTPDTMVESALGETVRTVRDTVAGWDRRLTVVTADQGDQWRTAAAQLGIALTQHGYDVTFASGVPGSNVQDTILVGPADRLFGMGWKAGDTKGDGVVTGTVADAPVLGIVESQADVISRLLTTPALAAADTSTSAPQAVATTAPTGNPVTLSSLGADLSEQQITESQRWRVGYSPADLPGGMLPKDLRVAFQLPASPADLTWILNVQLNGRLIDSRPLAHSTEPVVIPLPPTAQKVNNNLVIEVERDRDLGGCGVRVTSYPIQLLDTSVLDLGDQPMAGFTGVPRTLAPGFAVYVPGANPQDTDNVLTAALPTLATFVPAQYSPAFHWNAQPAPGQPFVLLGQSPDVSTVAHVQDGRLVAGNGQPLNVSSFANGVLSQCATGPGGAGGLAIQPVGEAPAVPTPDFGQECIQVATTGGSFALDPNGAVVLTGPPRAAAPR
ncbi:hypothetical protein [Speluncibacter jeojiensis]|uniref:Cellulose biosynthesis cyclic di-GMP-binding regulatory protein BcsB n=1 Tax=Speluncibacter jeojiensis TaxID=2710754 RepID=A0A9X4M1Q6_9ACTN|nr:hypothetical protein [Rhodococcus sp. D2-41]MDG3016395.1 cellulose biosynthesis cyclic di-GMP-binding regulatory protein BcsB [Corynebacteriales bacterium D3-21]